MHLLLPLIGRWKVIAIWATAPFCAGLAVCLEAISSTIPIGLGLLKNSEWFPLMLKEFPATSMGVAEYFGVGYVFACLASVALRRWPMAGSLLGVFIVTVARGLTASFVYPGTPFAREAVLRFETSVFVPPIMISGACCVLSIVMSRSLGNEEPDRPSVPGDRAAGS